MVLHRVLALFVLCTVVGSSGCSDCEEKSTNVDELYWGLWDDPLAGNAFLAGYADDRARVTCAREQATSARDALKATERECEELEEGTSEYVDCRLRQNQLDLHHAVLTAMAGVLEGATNWEDTIGGMQLLGMRQAAEEGGYDWDAVVESSIGEIEPLACEVCV